MVMIEGSFIKPSFNQQVDTGEQKEEENSRRENAKNGSVIFFQFA